MKHSKYWLIFRKGEHKFNFFLKKEFGHVGILYKDDFNWLLIDPSINKLFSIILPYDISDNVQLLYARRKGTKVLELDTIQSLSKKHVTSVISPLTCVSVAKYTIGIRKNFIQTPYQLYKWLCKIRPFDSYQTIYSVKQLF